MSDEMEEVPEETEFERNIRINKEKQDRLRRQRSEDNKKVKKSYRL